MKLKTVRWTIVLGAFSILLQSCSRVPLEPVNRDFDGTENPASNTNNDSNNNNNEEPSTDTTAPALTIEYPIDNTRINYSNFSALGARGTCDEKDGTVRVFIGDKEVGSAQCDGAHWTISQLNHLSSILPGSVLLRAEIVDAALNKGQDQKTVIRAPLDRQVSITATATTVERKNKLKVFLIIDNSSSMAEEQSRLASGLRRLSESLKGFEVEYFIYTTSISGGNRSVVNQSTTFISTNSLGGEEVRSQIKPPDAPTPYKLSTVMSLFNPQYSAQFTSNLSDADFNQRVQQLQSNVVSIGTSGLQNESGLLAMAHILSAADFESRFRMSVANGDKVAFLILSDNDDQSTIEMARNYNISLQRNISSNWSGLAKYEEDVQQVSGNYQQWIGLPNPTGALFTRVAGHVYVAHIRYQSLCNGDPCYADDYIKANQVELGLGSACGTFNCPAAMLESYKSTTGRTALSCQIKCFSRQLDFSPPNDLSKNYCATSFTTGGKTYANFYDWMAREQGAHFPKMDSCRHEYWKYELRPYTAHQPVAGSLKKTTIIQALTNSTTADLPGALRSKLQEKFGPQGYLVAAIINRADLGTAECRAQAEGTGSRYLQFLQSLGSQGFSDTICKDDYSSALSSIKTFAERVVDKTMALSLSSLESAFEVSIRRGSTVIALTADDFSMSTDLQFINLRPNLLQEGDIVDIKIRSL